MKIGSTTLTMLLAVALIACAGPNSALAGRDMMVTIGKEIAGAANAKSHDISVRALKAKRNDYVVTAPDGKVYKLKLNRQQIDDLLDGTTVIATTYDSEDVMKVSITKKRRRAVSSGW